MNFQPIDEMSLRHLFSTPLGREVLRMTYLGPVVAQNGKIETSPDALVVDMRNNPYKTRRCEFKFMPTGKSDFSHNGKFELAIVWKLATNVTKSQLANDLFAQNSCTEIIVLTESKAFSNLPHYTPQAIDQTFNFETVREIVLKRDPVSIVALYIAAALYPKRFNIEKVTTYLQLTIPSAKEISLQGLSNQVSAWIQTSPPLMNKVHGKNYEWSKNFSSDDAVSSLIQIITQSLRLPLPDLQDIGNMEGT